MAVFNAGEYAAFRESAIHKWVNDKTASGSEQVLTDATLIYNLSEDEIVMVTCMCFGLDTLADDCHFNIVSCDAVDGGGVATDISGHVHLFTGAAQSAAGSKERMYYPPIPVTYASGVRSITMKIHGNDSAAVISCGWMGYVEISQGT